MDHVAALHAIILAHPVRARVLALMQSLGLPDCWVGAGFVRNAVWDHLHGHAAGPWPGDVDVLWFHPVRAAAAVDVRLEVRLRAVDPGIDWSVKNQVRMHLRNGDPPYASVTDAMLFWPETATAVAVRLTGRGGLEVAAPFGLDDLFGLILRPTPRFMGEKHAIYVDRIETRRWRAMWPKLRMQEGRPA